MTDGPNPFTPTFGVSPPLLVGRDEDLELFVEALEEGPGSPARATLFTGQRGSGKTVLLNTLEDAARSRGWTVVSETARAGLAGEIASTSIPDLLQDHPGEAFESVLTGGNASAAGFGAGMTRERVDRFPVAPSLRSALTALADAMDRHGHGVLITVDEVSTDGLDDLQVITQVVQHAFREGRPVMFAAAGLPAHVQKLLEAPGTTFLRRAQRTHLGAVSTDDVARAIAEPMHHAGRGIEGEALQIAAEGTQGYPYMVQLVGYHAWRTSRGQAQVSPAQAARAVEAAGRRVGQLVHAPALAPLSAVDRTFLAAMALDDGPSRMADVAARMGVDTTYAGQYRLRLIEAELIHAPTRGMVDLSLPYMREHLRQHATHDVLRTAHRPPGRPRTAPRGPEQHQAPPTHRNRPGPGR